MTTPDRNISNNSMANKQKQSGRKHGMEMGMKQNRTYDPSSKNTTALLGGLALMGFVGLGLTGCSNGVGSASTTDAPVLSTHGAIHGNVHGGQQPVIGAKIQLYYVGSSGLGSAATALIPSGDQVVYNSGATAGTTGALTDSNGDFNITGDYTCPTPSQQVYLVATGGNSGSGTNTAISLMAPLGDCTTLANNASTTAVQINEVTTVASVYALAPYMTSYSHVGAASVNNTGLINAVGNFSTLASLSTGSSPGPSASLSSATVPSTEIYTLANIMASCINSTGISSPACSALNSATGATDTIGMMLYFAKNPASSTLTALWSQGSGTGPFQSGLSAQPNDWTIAIKYSAGGNFLAPYGIAFDAAGDAWVTNTAGSSVIKLSPGGVAGTTLTGPLVGPKGVAIDRSGNVWVANPTAGTVVKFAGGAGTGTAYTVGTGPVALAIDSAGTAWVANQLSNSISSVTSGGTVTSYSTGLNLNGPTGVALDTSGNVYIANNGGGNVVKLTNAGAAATGSPFTDNALQGTFAVGLDSSNNVYAGGSITGTIEQAAVSQFTSAGVAASYSPVSGTSATGNYSGLAVAGTNQIFATNSTTSGSLLSLTLASSPTAYQLGSLNTPVGVAIDPSGDVWTANSGDNTVSEFIGLTTPVTTPLAANVGP